MSCANCSETLKKFGGKCVVHDKNLREILDSQNHSHCPLEVNMMKVTLVRNPIYSILRKLKKYAKIYHYKGALIEDCETNGKLFHMATMKAILYRSEPDFSFSA